MHNRFKHNKIPHGGDLRQIKHEITNKPKSQSISQSNNEYINQVLKNPLKQIKYHLDKSKVNYKRHEAFLVFNTRLDLPDHRSPLRLKKHNRVCNR